MIHKVEGYILLIKAQVIAHGVGINDPMDKCLALEIHKKDQSMNKDIQILTRQKKTKEGWGRQKENAENGNTEWKTAIWFDKKRNTYLITIKATIRAKEHPVLGKEITVIVWV